MKKKIALIVCIVLLVSCTAALLAACDNKTGAEASDVSRSVSALYTGGGEDFVVSIEQGRREDPFIADGKVSEVKDFVELTVTPLSVNTYEEIAYVISDGAENGQTLSGTLTGNTFGEFRTEMPLGFVPASITLTAGEQTSEFELSNVLDGTLTAEDAVNVAKKQFAERIAAEEAEGKAAREIYVKLITGDRETYYFYVSFIGEGTDYWAALINPADGTVVSEK